jgi:hypothetical protein
LTSANTETTVTIASITIMLFSVDSEEKRNEPDGKPGQ